MLLNNYLNRSAKTLKDIESGSKKEREFLFKEKKHFIDVLFLKKILKNSNLYSL